MMSEPLSDIWAMRDHAFPVTPILATFEVIGLPAPQGSKVAFRVGKHARMKEASGAKHATWRDAVAVSARAVADDLGAPLDGPLGLSVEFRFPMAASRSKTARALGRIWKVSAPDSDKLMRSVGDALTAAGLIVDDARIARSECVKVEVTSWTGAIIRIYRLGVA